MFDLLTWLVPLGVLAAGLWRPRGGLLVLAACLPLFGAPPGGPYLAALDVAALAAIGTAWRAGPAQRSAADRPVLAFVVVSLASMLPAAYAPPSWQPRVLLGLVETLPYVQVWSALYTWRAALNVIVGWLLYLAFRRAFAGRDLRQLGQALALGLGTVLALGLAELAGALDLWNFRPIGGPLWDPRLHSTFFHSGWLAEYLVLATPVACAAILGNHRRDRRVAAVLALSAAIALTFTLQRGGWVAAASQCALAVFLVGRRIRLDRARLRRLALGAGTGGLLIASLTVARPTLVAPVHDRLADGGQLSGRWPIWEAAATMASERPLAGWGLGAFLPAFDRYDDGVAGAVHWLTPHNHYLMTAAERGLLGLASFAWLCWVLARCLSVGLAERTTRLQARGLAIALAGFLVYGLVQYLFFLKMIEWLFWILAAATAGLAPARPPYRPDRVAGVLAVAALVLVPWRLAIARTPAIETPTSGSFGFHRRELSGSREYAWTERRAARRVPWEDEVLVLELANGHPRAAERPMTVTIRADGHVRLRLTLRGGWEEHRIPLGPPAKESVVLEIQAAPAFRPYREFQRHPGLERSRDIRQLGIAVGSVRWEATGKAGE